MSKTNNGIAPQQPIAAQRVTAAMQVAQSGSGANAHELLNAYILQEEKKKVVKAYYDKLGQTMPASALVLATDAARNIRHSRALASNINKANRGQTRPQGVDAHHIVACVDFRARDARICLFNWGIGINDADNGVYLPRYLSSRVPSLPLAPNHQGLHTDDYYFSVTMRLDAVKDDPASEGRLTLRSIKNELIAGTFPF